jgi:hypothetical protein
MENKTYCQHGFAKSGAELQASTFGILLSNIVNLSIRISNSPPSASPKPISDNKPQILLRNLGFFVLKYFDC